MLEKIKTNLVKIGLILAGIFGAVFYVLFQQKKDEKQEEIIRNQQNEINELQNQNEQLQQETAEAHAVVDVIEQAQQAVVQEQIENEELVETALGGNNLNSFNACLDVLSK